LERQLKQSPESEDEAAAAARQLRSEEAQKLVKAWGGLCCLSKTPKEEVRGSVKVPPRQEFGGGCVPDGLK